MNNSREDELTRLAVFEALAATSNSTPEYCRHSNEAHKLRARLQPITHLEALRIEQEREERVIRYSHG